MDGETTKRDSATVATSDIARLANVGRPAVSNWRRRFPDFPRPVGGSAASPQYSLEEVEAWLARHGKSFELTAGDRIWQRVRGAADDLRLGDLLGYLGVFLLFLQREPKQWKALADQPGEVLAPALTRAVAAAAPELAIATDWPAPDWVPIVRLVAEATEQQSHRDVFDFLVQRYLEVHSRRYAVTQPALAHLMVELVDVTGGSVFDPACRLGAILLAAAERGATDVCGQEVDAMGARLAGARLLLHGLPARVATGDSLRSDAFAGLCADAVVCNPPFNERSWGYEELSGDPRWEYGLPPRGEPELAWLQHCLAHAKPGGRVVILMPAGVASRRAGRRIRASLLRSGALRAVITLPANGSAGSSAPDIWVLHRPDERGPAPSHLLVVDASADLSMAAAAWRSYLAEPTREPAGPGRLVRIIDLLDEEVDVNPLRHLASPTATARFGPARTRMTFATQALAATLPDLVVPTGPESLSMTTVGELLKTGAIVIRQAPLKMATEEGATPVLTAKDVRHGGPPSGRAATMPGSTSLEPGDVVVPMIPRQAVVRVVTEGGALLGPQLFLFRPDPQRIDSDFLAGFLRAAQTRGASRGWSFGARPDVRRASIPRLSLAMQRDYGEAFRRLAAFEECVRETAEQGETLIALGFAGLADGSLRPRPATEIAGS